MAYKESRLMLRRAIKRLEGQSKWDRPQVNGEDLRLILAKLQHLSKLSVEQDKKIKTIKKLMTIMTGAEWSS